MLAIAGRFIFIIMVSVSKPEQTIAGRLSLRNLGNATLQPLGRLKND
jgi:hypothetical protein